MSISGNGLQATDCASRLDPFRSFRDTDIQRAGGSDYFITPLPARYGTWSAIKDAQCQMTLFNGEVVYLED